MPRKTTDNPELQALIGIEDLLEELTDAGKARVLRWANDAYAHVLRGGRPERVTDAVFAGPVGEPLDGSAHATRAGRTFQAVKAQDGRPAVAEP